MSDLENALEQMETKDIGWSNDQTENSDFVQIESNIECNAIKQIWSVHPAFMENTADPEKAKQLLEELESYILQPCKLSKPFGTLTYSKMRLPFNSPSQIISLKFRSEKSVLSEEFLQVAPQTRANWMKIYKKMNDSPKGLLAWTNLPDEIRNI